MFRRHPSVTLICVALLVTGCGRPSADETLPAGRGVTLDGVGQSIASARSLNEDWEGLYGKWCAEVSRPPGVKGLARCEVMPILNDHFLSCMLTFTSDHREGGMCLSFVVLQDASCGAFACWGLISTGEHMTATLVKPNQRSWTWSFTSVRADGVTGTATHCWTLVDNDTWIWEVKDRKWCNGTSSPGLYLTLNRERKTTGEQKAGPRDATENERLTETFWTQTLRPLRLVGQERDARSQCSRELSGAGSCLPSAEPNVQDHFRHIGQSKYLRRHAGRGGTPQKIAFREARREREKTK